MSVNTAVKLKTENHVDYSVDIVDLSKKFKRRTLAKSAYTTIKSSLISKFLPSSAPPVNYTEVIKDIRLRIPRGSSVGIIGRNGSGKSTLLKLITGIYKPDKGSISVNGKIAALIELGAGFHPDFTGRENLQLGAAMHGMSKKELQNKFEEIVAFAELEEVIDDPVKTYSSGMFMRLGFSLAIHTNPDILIVDEVLAVGDASFVTKCKEKIAQLRKDSKTLILVTHDMDAVERWCDEVLWLHAGLVKDRGDPRRVIDHYRQFNEEQQENELLLDSGDDQPAVEGSPESDSQKTRWGSREIEITGAKILKREGTTYTEHLLYHSDDDLVINIDYQVRQKANDVVFGICITRSDGLIVHGSNTDIEKIDIKVFDKGTVSYYIKYLGLLEGNYSLDVAVHRSDGYPFDYHKNAVTFAVRSKYSQAGLYVPQHSWEYK
jgi:lipopolysaccharide transport system ATP-binding protein